MTEGRRHDPRKMYVLYHAECADGFGAAWAAWKALGDRAEYIPVSYGQSPPEMAEGSDVYIIDFSYAREVLEGLSCKHRMAVLDHHKSAEEDLAGLDYAIFDMNHSGAFMAWHYFVGAAREIPELLLYVEDRDLWKWELPDSREVNAAISSRPRDFKSWSALAVAGVYRLRGEGRAILRAQAQVVEQTCRGAYVSKIGGYEVPTVNATAHVSEVGQKLLELYPERPFSASFWVVEGGRVWSLRSRGDFDVSEIARGYGGGGHAAAAGFQTADDQKAEK